MIAASEPLEFVPRGRQAVEEHPGPLVSNQGTNIPLENVILQRMQNVNISTKEVEREFWCVREIYKDCNDVQRPHGPEATKKPTAAAACDKNGVSKSTNEFLYPDGSLYTQDIYVNSEEELYVKKCTAVWTRGLATDDDVLPRICLTCETPIKFAFFCSDSFIQRKANNENATAICLIDSTSLRVYCSNGEDFLCNLEFPVSHVWSTCYGILLEKEPSNAIIQSQSICMPRVFSLTHPLNEICPVLNKSATGVISYLIEADYKVVFSDDCTNLVLLFNHRNGNHFVARLRKATEDEVNCIGSHNDTVSGTIGSTTYNINNRATPTSASMNFQGSSTRANTPNTNRSNVNTPLYPRHISKFLSGISGAQTPGSQQHFNTSRVYSQNHLSRLESSIGQNSMSVYDIRKLGQSQPSKPLVPELCLEHIWTESQHGQAQQRNEVATHAFIHTDLVGQTFLCYLLPGSLQLQMVELINYGKDIVQLIKCKYESNAIPAKDAVVLKRMNMIAVLDPNSTLVLYTGLVKISKVHVASVISSHCSFLTPKAKTIDVTFPRRSSLLPSVQNTSDILFEEDLHLLSPVHPLPSQRQNRKSMNQASLSLRDPAGNRVTLVTPSGKMYRISLPLINETKLVTRCIVALRQILNPSQFIQFIIRWYCARNPPGSQDFNSAQEWETFKHVLLDLMGCSLSWYSSTSAGSSPKKRRKDSENASGSDEDWQYLLSVLDPHHAKPHEEEPTGFGVNIDVDACLFKMIPAIFYALHLLYEDLKLDDTMQSYLITLAEFLHQLAKDMRLASYTHHYSLDFPHLLLAAVRESLFTEVHGAQMLHQELLRVPAPSIFAQLEKVLLNRETIHYLYMDNVNDRSRNILQVVSLILHGIDRIKAWIKPLVFPDCLRARYPERKKRFISLTVPRSEQVIQMLLCMNMSRIDIERLPVAIHLIIAECLERSRLSPPVGCSPPTYELILRSELVEHAKFQSDGNLYEVVKFKKSNIDAEDSLSARCPPSTNGISRIDAALDDGMDNVDTKLLSLRFPDDLRIAEVRRLLNSSEPVLIDIPQTPGISDHDFLEEQEKQLFALCTRTMGLPIGRGMLTLRTSIPTPTESMPIPKLCLTGKDMEKGTTIELQQIEIPANASLWPIFHNGVAAGLKISPNARDIDSTWIGYNRPRGQTEIPTEHAGLLMALGLNGHLKALSLMSMYDYLMRFDEMASIALLVGIAATYRGTMDNIVTKLLSVHVEALLPATALELDIPHNIQVAALMGVGLLYQGTAKRHIAEVLLQEIGRPPGPEMENSVERESYALTAGLALGLVTLGKGESPAGLRDLQLPDTLHYYMVGGNKRFLTGSQKEKYKLPSFQVREGDNVNIDVTAPGATLALGLMFFDTGNSAVFEWMNPPDSSYLLELVRPDLLLLRTIARGLIMWSDIKPDADWLFGQFPNSLRFDVERNAIVSPVDDVDHEAITQAYCNIVTGAAFCIGLRYAGTENKEAFASLQKAIKLFLSFPGKYVGEHAGKSTMECSLIVMILSMSLVFAGTGNLEILRIIRYLRSRIGLQHGQVTYGSHMGIHMALGFLFLGAGRFSLAKTPEAVAALVCALFPKFPNHSNDNRYHLQAFRHLYVLAIEPRLFLPRDIDTKKLCLCNVSVLELGSDELRRLPLAPCMLPDLATLQKVIIDDPIYWPVSFEKGRNWQQLVKALEVSGCIDIKKRSGCLSHLEDPDRLKSLFAQTLTTEQYTCWKIDIKTLETFSNDSFVIGFTDRFLSDDSSSSSNGPDQQEQHLQHKTIIAFYNAVIKDKMHALPIYLAISNALRKIAFEPRSHDVWQMKLIDIYMNRCDVDHVLVSREIINSYGFQLKLLLEKSRNELRPQLAKYIAASGLSGDIIDGLKDEQVAKLMAVIVYYGLPANVGNLVNLSGAAANYIRYLFEFSRLGLEPLAIHCLLNVLITKT